MLFALDLSETDRKRYQTSDLIVLGISTQLQC